GRANEPAPAALRLVRRTRLVVLDDLCPCVDRIPESPPRLPEPLEQEAADVGVLDPERRVRVPGERRAARAPAGLVVGHVRPGRRVTDGLRPPRDEPVLDVDVPGARAGAVDPVRRADDLVVLPAVAVEGLPFAAASDQLAPALRRRRPA